MNTDIDLNRRPLVTVLVITYNSSDFVLETLNSTCNQTYKNLELIISDDCSMDNTLTICDDWLEKNGKFFRNSKLITNPTNTGIPSNCNRGLKHSSGEWIKIIAGDDAMLPNCIRQNVDFINSHENIMILFSYANMYLDRFEPKSFIQKYPSRLNRSFFNPQITANEQYLNLLTGNKIHSTVSAFIFREALINVGGYDERYKYIEDYPMWLKLTLAGYKLHFMEQVTVNYRRHDKSIHNKTNLQVVHPTFIKSEELMKEYIYPNVIGLVAINYKYIYFVSKLIIRLNLNKYSIINKFIYKLLINYINPLRLIIRLKNILKYIN